MPYLLRTILPWLCLLPHSLGAPPALDPDWGHGWATAGSMLWLDIAARSGPLLPAQLRFMADTYSIVSLEKCFNLAQFPGSTEGGARNASAALRALNPNLKVTFYFHRHKFFDNCFQSNAAFNRAAWAAVDDAGLPFSPILYNTSLPGVQAYLANSSVLAEDGSAPDGAPYFDGVFADGTAEAATEYGISEARHASIVSGSHASLALTQAAVRRAMRPGARLIGNGITMYANNPPDHGLAALPWVDGFCHEHFLAFEQLDRATGAASPQMYAQVVSALRNATAAGRVVLVKGWPGPACSPIGSLGPTWCGSAAAPALATAAGRGLAAAQLLTPTLAGFLVLSDRLMFLSYTWWYTETGGGVPCAPGSEGTCTFPSAGWYPELSRPLGAPLADFAVSSDGAIYTREFEHASVRFNAANVSNSSITWHAPSAPSSSTSTTGTPSFSPTPTPTFLPAPAPSLTPSPSAPSLSAATATSTAAAAATAPSATLSPTPSPPTLPSTAASLLGSPLAQAAGAASQGGAAGLDSGAAAGVALAVLAALGACALAARSSLARAVAARALTGTAAAASRAGHAGRGERLWPRLAQQTEKRKGSVAAQGRGGSN